jgi:hypothetical protein
MVHLGGDRWLHDDTLEAIQPAAAEYGDIRKRWTAALGLRPRGHTRQRWIDGYTG